MPLSSNAVLVIDVETTGFDPARNACIEIGAVLLDDNMREIDEFSSLIAPWPGAEIVAAALEVNGIDPCLLSSAPALFDVIEQFHAKFCYSPSLPVLAGWNVWFDVSFLRALYSRANLRWPFGHRFVDVQSIVTFFNGMQPTAQEVVVRGEFWQQQSHRALGDARHTSRILRDLALKHL